MSEKSLTVKKFDSDLEFFLWKQLCIVAKDLDYEVIEKTGGYQKRKSVSLRHSESNDWMKVRLIKDPRFINVECRIETVNSNLNFKVSRDGSMHTFIQDFLNGWDNK